MTALDVIVQRQVLDELRALQQRLNVAIILVTHDMAVVAYTCDRVAVMYAGKMVKSGPTARDLGGTPYHPYTMGLTHFPGHARKHRGTRADRGCTALSARSAISLPLCGSLPFRGAALSQ